MSTETQSSQARVVNAALVVGVLLLVSSVLNLLRDLLLSAFYGTDSAEAIAVANVIPLPELVFVLISGGALGSAFIPVFTRFFADDDNPDFVGASELFSAVVTLVTLAGIVATGLAFAFASPLLSWWYAQILAEQPDLLDLMVPLFRIMLVAQVVFGVSGVVMVTLYARQKFLMPALAVAVYAVGQIIGLVALRPNIQGLAWGMVLGACGHLAIQLPQLRREGIWFRPKIAFANPHVRRVLWLMAPRTLGLAFSYLNPIFIPLIAQTLVAGSTPALRFANRIMLTPQAFIGRALGTASFPTFAEMAVRGEYGDMRRMINNMLRLILFIGTPLTILMAVLANPLIRLVFERGEFSAESTMLTANALVYFSLAFIALSIIEILARAFYALEDTWTPVWVGGVQLGMMFGLSMWLGRSVFPAQGWFGVGGVALGYSLSNWFEVVVLLLLLRRKMQGLDVQHLADGVWRIAVAGVAMAVIIAGMWRFLGNVADMSVMYLILMLGIISAVGGFAYLAICYALALTEMRSAMTAVAGRFGRKLRSA